MDGDNRFYGVGHFDLIIFDEIHRSVYNRYKAIFKYFDGIRIGLTATPKTETSKDTYELFGMEANNPTFAYELDEAVRDGFLVPPVAISVPTKFHREGIKYSELSDEEKEEYEEKFSDPITEELFLKEIDSNALNDWLFNTNTVDKILSHIMEHGIKVEGGDKLAKTMIFARSHSHAKFIEERFNEQFKQYKGEFLRVIDYQEEQRKSLLESFKDNNSFPQIAVSVDMLDTGIDVPEVCNLVFYKPVKSLTKFWQMVGRGTRLCENLFGHGQHKKEFLIFDFCENFEFFEVNPKGIKTNTIKSISQRLFELRLRLMVVLSKEENSALKKYSEQILNRLIGQTQALDLQSFIVRQHLQTVEKYRDSNVWKDLSDLDIKEIFDHIAPIVLEADTDELAKRFDLILLDIQLKTKTGEKAIEELTKRVRLTASKLSKKGSIPKVAEKMDIIREAEEENFWKDTEIPIVEKIRIELRSLIQFLDSDSTNIVTTNFEDEIGDGTIKDLSLNLNDLDTYKRKVERYLKENNNHTTIYKIRNNLQITEKDIKELERMLFDQGSLGTKKQFVEAYGEQPLGRFIRSIVGLEAKVAKELFGKILENQTLNARQIKFMDTIINYLCVKGVIDPAMLFEPPFTDISSNGISDVFDDSTTDKIISLIEEINKKADAA
jgi:type I restriction enzyme R subunit